MTSFFQVNFSKNHLRRKKKVIYQLRFWQTWSGKPAIHKNSISISGVILMKRVQTMKIISPIRMQKSDLETSVAWIEVELFLVA